LKNICRAGTLVAEYISYDIKEGEDQRGHHCNYYAKLDEEEIAGQSRAQIKGIIRFKEHIEYLLLIAHATTLT
jgi:hypothetical protein